MRIVPNTRKTVGAGSQKSLADEKQSASDARWQQEMKAAFRDFESLGKYLRLPEKWHAEAVAAQESFPLFVTRPFAAKMKKGDPADPLLRQVLPVAEEAKIVHGFSADPVGDAAATLVPGLLQKFKRRALLIAASSCAVHCRYCFRRHFPYSSTPHQMADWQPALDQLAVDASIQEVILSGGDPLTLNDTRLTELVSALDAMQHVRRIRIHTRLPLMIPTRVTSELGKLLSSLRAKPVVVLHVNHAAEIDRPVVKSLERLRSAGALLLNQAVLLRGVNDSADTLRELSERLADCHVQPYYLHQLDAVQGAAHFKVPIAEGKKIVQQLRESLSGYLVPKYVQEIAGAAHKIELR